MNERGNRSKNVFQKLVELCNADERRVGDVLLDYQNIDQDVLVYFITMAFTTTANVRFSDKMLYEKLSDATTVSEEAFAILVFENNFERWVYLSEREVRKTRRDASGVDENGIEEENNNDGIPDVLYQRKVKLRKDNRETAGKWTDKGMERYNELLTMVTNSRNSNWRPRFEEKLQERYENSDDNSIETGRKRKKRISEEPGRKKARVSANNMLDVMSL